MRFPPSAFTLSFLGAGLAPGSNFALAIPVSWTDGTGFWDVAGNWSPGVPGPGDDVTINVAGSPTVTHRTGNDTVRTVTIGPNPATLLVNNGSTLAISTGAINGGTMQADGAGSGLSFDGGTVANGGGVLAATNGGTIGLNSVTVS